MGFDDATIEGALPRLGLFARILVGEGVSLGFLGPSEGPRVVPRHVLESAALAPWVGSPVIDVGSGAGLPGLVLACLLPGHVTLLEAEGRRAAFLERTARALEVDAQIVRARAEEAGRDPSLREMFATAVARALAPPPVALELCLPFVRLGGKALISVGPTAAEAREEVRLAAGELGGAPPDLRRLEVPGAEGDRYVIIVEKRDAVPDRYPRRTGVPSRRPLGRTR